MTRTQRLAAGAGASVILAAAIIAGPVSSPTVAPLDATAPVRHVAVNGEVIYIPAGVTVSLVNGTPPPATPSPRPSASPTPTLRPSATPSSSPTVAPSPSPTAAPARTITCAAGRPCYVPKAGEVIDGWTIRCPGDQTYDAATTGIWINQPNVTVRNTTVSGCGNADVWIDGATGFLLEGNTFTDAAYAGVITTGATKGTIRGNLIQRIGTRGHQRDANAYGIAISMWGGGIPSSDVIVDANTVEDVPLWHGMDTHGGIRITFSGNTVRRTPRAVFITANLAAERSQNVIVARNTLLEPVSGIAGGGTDGNTAITLYDARSTSVTDNVVDPRYPNILNDSGGLSQGTVQAGNRRAA